MCGIIGICGLSSASRIAEEDFVRARDTMQTRGPDAAGYVTFGDGVGGICHFGHRRLSIRDLSDNGNQPMHSGSGRFTIVYNGEVYNTKALRRALTAEGVGSDRGRTRRLCSKGSRNGEKAWWSD